MARGIDRYGGWRSSNHEQRAGRCQRQRTAAVMVAAAAAAADRRQQQGGRQSEQERKRDWLLLLGVGRLLLLPLPRKLAGGQDRRKVVSLPRASSYNAVWSCSQPDSQTARIDTLLLLARSLIHIQLESIPSLHCTPGDPMSLLHSSSSGPCAPSQLRRPLRGPSFAPTLAAWLLLLATDSIRIRFPPLQFFISPALGPGPGAGSQLPFVTCPQTRLCPPTSLRKRAQVLGRSLAVGSFLILTPVWPHLSAPVWHAKIRPSGSNVHQIPGTSMLETVDPLDIWFVTSIHASEPLPLPLFFVLLTCSYDLLSFTHPCGLLRVPVAAATQSCRHNPRPRSRCQSTRARAINCALRSAGVNIQRHIAYPPIPCPISHACSQSCADFEIARTTDPRNLSYLYYHILIISSFALS